MPQKLVNSFNFPLLCKRAKKTLKKKYGKDVSIIAIKQIWKDWVEYAIILPLLRDGKVQIDDKFSMEIFGKRFEDDPQILTMMEKGLNHNGITKEAVRFDSNRYGVKYKVDLIDRNYRGVTVFDADPKLSKRVHEELKNTQTYYRILR